MKNRNIVLIILIIFALNNCFLYSYINITNPKNEIENLVFGYQEKVKVNKYIDLKEEVLFDTSVLGERIYEDEDNIIHYKVIDKTSPLILGNNVTTTLGKKVDLVNKFLCGDDLDDTPKCYIQGDYDINKIGTYKLTYVAVDNAGNASTKNFNLKVIAKTNNNPSSNEKPRINISEYIKKYKTNFTSIGIDVSSWQYDIDWNKVKNDGVEFAMIRIGFGHTNKGEIIIDNTFENNLKNAKKAGIKVGIYFYSYASDEQEAREQMKWIVKKLNGEKLDLPIAFDWEDWGDFNSYKVSFKTLSNIADAFIDEAQKNGYEGMLYGSAYYLNTIWKSNQKTWLAYYTDNNDYKGDYMMWQLSSRGKVSGINAAVDINVLYK